MALSSWDTMAFDSEGKPSGGSVDLPDGASLEIYKNWLYVKNPKLWRKGQQFTSHVIAQIEHGNVTVSGFEIHAVRHQAQDSVFCFASHREYTGKGKKKYDTHQDYYLAGIGCYGFKSEEEWLKEKHPKIYASIDPECWDDNKYMMSTSHGPNDEWGYEWYGRGKRKHKSLKMSAKGIERPGMDEYWTGVLPSTAAAFFKWLKKVAPKEYFAKIDQANPLRYNQGDAFFASALNTPLNATAPGESQGTVMGQMLGSKKAAKKSAKKK